MDWLSELQGQRCACPACGGVSGSDVLAETPDSAAGSIVNNKPFWSVQQVVTNFTFGHLTWRKTAVPYAFMTSGDAFFAPLTELQKSFTREAFDLIADVVNLSFVEVADDGSRGRSSGKILFGLDTEKVDGVWGYAQRYSGFFGNELAAAEIRMHPDAVAKRAFVMGGANFRSLMHEILHGLGLPHPGAYNAGGDQPEITYATHAGYAQDSLQYTLMSYFGAEHTGADFVYEPTGLIYSAATPLLHDVAALQAKYGANTSTRSGDTVYGFNSTAGRAAYDFVANVAPIVTIWDGGGIDTLDLSGAPGAVDLDLREGAFSDAIHMTDNISIAYGAKIENARGGGWADRLTGNALDNVLEGGGGDDVFFGLEGADVFLGGEGADTAEYAGKAADFEWWSGADGVWSVRSTADGTDRLSSVEALRFGDRTVKILNLTVDETIAYAFENVLRYQPGAADQGFVAGLIQQVSSGAGLRAAFEQIVRKADATTAVATLAYQFFVGSAPSKAGIDYLVAPTGPNPNNLNSAYYQSFGLENRYINFAVNLGKLGEGRAGFEQAYAALTLEAALGKAYATIFGAAPTADKIDAILDAQTGIAGLATRADYFAYYGQDGLDGIGTKAAMVGWLLAEAEKADVGVYARSNAAFLLDLADGARSQIDLIGVYSSPDFVYA